MDDPDVIVGVDADADRHALIPVVGQRLRERRIDFEARDHDLVALGLRVRLLLEEALPEAERDEQRGERRTDVEISFHDASSQRSRSRERTSLRVLRVLRVCVSSSRHFFTNFWTRLPS